MGDNTYLDLPPIGAPDAGHKLAQFGNMLRIESVTQRAPYIGTNGDFLDRFLSLYLFGREDGSSIDARPTLNKIQGTINTFSSLATRTPAAITLRCVSVEEDAVWILKKPYSVPPQVDPATGQPAIDPATGIPHQAIALPLYQPIDDAVVDMIPEKLRVALSSENVVAYYQSVFDFTRRVSRVDCTFREMIHNTQIYGWHMAIFGWDAISKLPVLDLLPCQQWYPHTIVSDVKDMVYVGADWPIDAELAKRMFPNAATAIDDAASKAIDYATGSAGYSNLYNLLAPQRPMVTLQYFWLRNQEAPMTLAEGLETSLLSVEEPANVPTDSLPGEDTLQAAGALPGEGDEASEAERPAADQGESAGEDQADAGAGDDAGGGSGLENAAEQGSEGDEEGAESDQDRLGIVHGNPSMANDVAKAKAKAPSTPPPPPVAIAAVVAPPARKITHAMTGEDLTGSFNDDGTPADTLHANHPHKLVTRQWVQVKDNVIQDQVCPHWDIPVLLNKNVPIPNRPFGQSETIRLRSPQSSINNVHGSTVDHIGWFKGPTGMMVRGNEERLPDDFRNGFAKPNKIYLVDAEVFTDAGPGQAPIMFIKPPDMPPALPMMRTQLDADYNDVAGHPDVEQGETPPGVHSGVAIRSLQGASQASSGFKSMYTEEAIWRWAMLNLHAIIHWMSVEDLMQINRSLPAPIVELYRQFALKMRWDADVDLATGGGQVKADHDNQVRNDFSTHLIDKRTARKKLDYDADEIERNEEEDAKNMAMAQGPMPPR